VGILEGGDGSGLDEELIDADQTANVTARNVFDGFDVTAHHEDGALDGLLVQVLLLARNIVGSHDADLQAGSDLASEDTTEGVEAALVGSGDHLRDVHHERALGVAVLHCDGGLVIKRTLVQHVGTVLLGGDGRRQVDDDHLKHGLASREPVSHDRLEERLAFLGELIGLQLVLDAELLEELIALVLLEVHDGVEDHVDGLQDVHAEGTLVVLVLSLAPLLGLGVEKVFAPELVHQLLNGNVELGGIHLGHLLEGEGPAVEAGAETNRGVGGVDADDAHGTAVISVGGDDDVDVFDDALESLVQIFGFELELEKSSVHLVHEDDGTNSLRDGLTQDGLSLDADTCPEKD